MSLFDTTREIVLFFGLLLCIGGINLFLEYQNYENFTANKHQDIDAKVLAQYQKINKKGKPYTVLKLQELSHNTIFYTSTKDALKPLFQREIALRVITDKVNFVSFLKGFYVPSYGYALQPKKQNIKTFLEDQVSQMHQDPKAKELFLALFFAHPISQELRQDVQRWGISHLIALSGFHIAIFSSLVIGLLYLFYRPLQEKFFPFRHRYIDLFVLSHVILGVYVFSLGIVPSLIRAYIMSLCIFFLYVRGIKILSIWTLFLVVCIIISFYPRLALSIGFWFSVSGVYLIYLYLRYFSNLSWWKSLIFINLWLTFLMMPVVHYVFPLWSPLHLLSPLVTIVFSLFYPLEIFLHVIEFGGILDTLVVEFLQTPASLYELYIPFWFLVFYIVFMIGMYFIKELKR